MDDADRGWIDISDDESDAVWERFFREFAFRPSTDPWHWPGVRIPNASVTWDLAASWQRPHHWSPHHHGGVLPPTFASDLSR